VKQFFAVAIVLYVSICAQAQTWDEWFNQKSTQIKYLRVQIAANQIYIDAIEKSYAIAKDGLKAINDIKHSDFNLHNDYFSSLNNVNPAIKNSSKVSAIITLQLKIKKDLSAAKNQMNASGQFTETELQYLQTTSDNLLNECSKNINELTTIISAGQTSMTDDERIKGIGKIYKAMQEHLTFERSFTSEALMLCYQRKAEQADLMLSKKLNGLK